MKTRERPASPRPLAVLAALAIAALLLSACGKAAAPSSLAGSDPNLAPDFQATTMTGQRFVLSEQRGKPVILFFSTGVG